MILLTYGGCKAPIDEVRHIGNFSSGRYGAEIAEALSRQVKAEVTVFLAEKGSVNPKCHFTNEGDFVELDISGDMNGIGSVVIRTEYKYFNDYLDISLGINRDHKPRIIISAAAISDFIPAQVAGKISMPSDEVFIKCIKTPKVLRLLRDENKEAYIVGFKLLVSPTEEDKKKAITKVLEYADIVVFNDLTELKKGNSTREVHTRAGEVIIAPTADKLVEIILRQP